MFFCGSTSDVEQVRSLVIMDAQDFHRQAGQESTPLEMLHYAPGELVLVWTLLCDEKGKRAGFARARVLTHNPETDGEFLVEPEQAARDHVLRYRNTVMPKVDTFPLCVRFILVFLP